MAVAAFRELGVDACRVRRTMTITALGNRFVLIRVAFHAADATVLGLGRQQLVVGGAMASGTQHILCRSGIFKDCRLMGSMAG